MIEKNVVAYIKSKPLELRTSFKLSGKNVSTTFYKVVSYNCMRIEIFPEI